MVRSVDKNTLLKRIGDRRGFRFGMHDLLAEVNPEFMNKWNEWIEYTYLNSRHLDRKTKELIVTAVCSALRDTPAHIQLHVNAAADAGATKEEIMEAVTLQGQWAGGLGVANGLEAWRMTFRPDLPTVIEPTKTRIKHKKTTG